MRHLPLLNPAMCHLPHLIPCRRSQQSCCGSVYIPLDPAAPSQLAPWEWKGWLEMCKGTGDIETALSECCRKGRGVDSMLWLEKAGKHHFCARLPLWLPQSGSVPLFQAAERTAPHAVKLGLIKMEARETVALRLAVSGLPPFKAESTSPTISGRCLSAVARSRLSAYLCATCLPLLSHAWSLQEASRANVNVALSQQCNPNINVNPK